MIMYKYIYTHVYIHTYIYNIYTYIYICNMFKTALPAAQGTFSQIRCDNGHLFLGPIGVEDVVNLWLIYG